MDNKNTNNSTGAVKPSTLSNEGESLEFSADSLSSTGTANQATQSDQINATNIQTSTQPIQPEKDSKFRRVWEKFNIYLLLFILIIVLSVAVIAVLYFKNRGNKTTVAPGIITQQKLSSDALQQLATNGIQVGDPKQVLNVQSNSVFASTVLVKGELQVAGGLKIGSGSLAVPDVDIGGTALINQLQAKSLVVGGNGSIQGQLTIQQNLSVNGNGVFNGAVSTPQLNAGKLQITGDLTITRHLVAGGSIPKKTSGNLGNGGTSSNSGSDTAGSITVNTGGGTTSGCLVTITFAQPFNTTPHIGLTPVGSAAAGLEYYITHTTSSFSVCTNNAPPANQSFGFDYIALD